MNQITIANPKEFKIIKGLGDPHNFGRATSLLEDGRILKPRSVFWEHALLSPYGTLRLQIEDLWQKVGGFINAMPKVAYEAVEEHGFIADAVQLSPLPARPLSDRELEGCGTTLAQCLFFGIHDLHRENIVCGIDHTGRFVFGPIDIECVMARLSSLIETHLLPQVGLHASICGLASIKEHLIQFPRPKARARLIAAFCAALSTLHQESYHLDATTRAMATEKDAWLRIVFRATSHYRKIIEKLVDPQKLRCPLIPEEKIQLDRGDIPYFCCLMTEKGIQYFDTSSSLKEVAPHPEMKLFQLIALRDLAAAWNMDDLRKKQMQKSALELAKFLFDEPELTESAAGIEIKIHDQQIAIYANGNYECA